MTDHRPGPPAQPAPVRLALLDRADLRRCAEIEQYAFAGDDPWSEKAFASELDHGAYYVGAYDNGTGNLLGYAGIAVIGRYPRAEAEVHTIAVDPQHRGAGIGRALLRALLTRADEQGATTFLEVRTDNDVAIKLYEQHGFEFVGLRRRYYQPSGADAHTMRREPGHRAEKDGVA